MNAVETIDELVREYLVFRGCLGALRAWEADLKADRDKGFQVERIVDQLFAAISAYDLAALTDLWNYLDTRFFARLEEQHLRTVKRLELCLFRYYLVHAAQHNRRDKILEFFETLGQEAVDSDDWTPWFCTLRARTQGAASIVPDGAAVALVAVAVRRRAGQRCRLCASPRRTRTLSPSSAATGWRRLCSRCTTFCRPSSTASVRLPCACTVGH